MLERVLLRAISRGAILCVVERIVRVPPVRAHGGMTERTKVLVLKTSEAQASVGSNPTPSATPRTLAPSQLIYELTQRQTPGDQRPMV